MENKVDLLDGIENSFIVKSVRMKLLDESMHELFKLFDNYCKENNVPA